MCRIRKIWKQSARVNIMKKKKKVCKSKCKSKNCDSPCSKKVELKSKVVKKILSEEPLVYIEPIVPPETLWNKILKFLRLR